MDRKAWLPAGGPRKRRYAQEVNRMTTLIELFDDVMAFNNFLLTRLLKPDELILLAAENSRDWDLVQERFESFKRYFKLKTAVTFFMMDTRDIRSTADALHAIIRERGEENCVIDVIGGDETLLMAVGMCASAYPHLRIMTLRNAQPTLIWGEETPEEGRAIQSALSVSVRDAIAMAAGEMVRCGHADWRALDDYMFATIPVMFEIYLRNRAAWSSFTSYLQRLNSSKYKVQEGVYSGPVEFTINPMLGKKVRLNASLMQEFSDAGVITECRIMPSVVHLAFAHPQIVKYLCDPGSWLELFVFSVLKKSGLFTDIEINPVVSWDNDEDNDDTINEVDLIAMKGIVPVFISCKSSVLETKAVNELLAITRRFGNYNARAVLITACNAESDAYAAKHRALENGMDVLDAASLTEQGILSFFRNMKWDR